MTPEPDLALRFLGLMVDAALAVDALEEEVDQANERDRKGRLRWLRADGTRP